MATQGIKFLYQFSVGEMNAGNPGVNVISVTSTAVGDHDKKNLTSQPLRETWRSTDTTTQEIVLQANDTTVIPDVFAIMGHNFSSNAIVTLMGNNSNSWGSPAFQVTLAYNKKIMAYVGSLGAAFQYYKVKIQDAGNPCGYIEIGRILAGKSFTFTSNEDIDDNFSISTQDLAYQMKSEGFFRASNERVKIASTTLNFPQLNSSPANGPTDNYEGLLSLADFVGTTLPFLTIVDPSDPYFKIFWGQFNKLPSESYSVSRYVTLKCDIDETY